MAKVEVLSIYDEVKKEREYQDKKWGGPANDDLNTLNDWVSYITRYATGWQWLHWNVNPGIWNPSVSGFRIHMIKVAALAIAATEWADRKLERRNEDG